MNSISRNSTAMLILSGLCILSAIFLPIWSIYLDAPQYPEGLGLSIYANKLGGDVDIINGLNHYIGMQTLHAENFVEFSVLKYILLFFSLLIFITAIVARKRMLYITFIAFILFSVLSMADFYRWNYNYGHNLDPDAAIKVPGMSYQPPLIGYKQLLNFGAYSMPARGGLLFIGAGVLMLIVVLNERKVFARFGRKKTTAAAGMVLMALSTAMTSCSPPEPRPIKLNEDACSFCKMTITDAAFAAELTTKKGRQYVFDDLSCMKDYIKENSGLEIAGYYVTDFIHPGQFVNLSDATLIQSDSLRSPMGGNIAGFADRDSAVSYKSRFNAQDVNWGEWTR